MSEIKHVTVIGAGTMGHGIAHVAGCFWYLIGVQFEDRYGISWISDTVPKYPFDEGLTLSTYYLWSFYYAMVTMTTVGYGDISPVTPVGRVVAGVLILLGLGMFSYFTGLMTAAVEDPEEEQLIDDLAQVKAGIRGLKGQLDRIERLLERRGPPPD